MAEQQVTLKRKRHRTGFTPVPNDLLTNEKISGLAKALWCLLFSKPDGWTFYWGEILSNFKEGRDSVKKAAKELESFGYLTKRQTKKSLNGKMIFGGMEIELDDMPDLTASEENQPSIPITEFQSPEIPSLEVPVSEAPITEGASAYKHLSKKDLFDKDLSKSLSLEEVKNYIENLLREREENFSIDAKKCFDWLTAQGKKLKNSWQSVVLSWIDKPENQIAKKSTTPTPFVEESEEVKNLRSRIKFELGLANLSNASGYFLDAKIEKVGDGWVVKVQNPKALEFQGILAKINIKIEVK